MFFPGMFFDSLPALNQNYDVSISIGGALLRSDFLRRISSALGGIGQVEPSSVGKSVMKMDEETGQTPSPGRRSKRPSVP